MSQYKSNIPKREYESYEHFSDLVKNLKEELQPPSHLVACVTCPISIWFTTEEELRCYCKTMNAIVYSEEQEPITNCDGREQAIASLLAEIQ